MATYGSSQRESESDRTAEDFPVLKKYGRDDGSVMLRIEGKPTEPESPLEHYAYQNYLQVCDIKLLELDGEKSAEIYGNIYMSCWYEIGSWDIFRRERENAEIIEVPGVITSTPPIVAYSPYDPHCITFDLKGKLEDMEEQIVWWMPDHPHNSMMVYEIGGPTSCLEVSMITFRKAVLTDMVIDLPCLADEEGIYGSITVSYSGTASDVGPLFMFNKKQDDSVPVTAEKPIPLTRPHIVVPYDNGLVIEVNLHTVSGVPITQGSISILGHSSAKWFGILERLGEIPVRAEVKFFPCRTHPATSACEHKLYASL